MWYLVSLLSPIWHSDQTVRVEVEFPYETSCQRALVDELAQRRREFDKQGQVVILETCIYKDKQILAQNSR